MPKLLFKSEEWDFKTIEKTWEVIDDIGRNHFGLDYYDSQIEMITADQMLEAYSSNGLPIMYNHWEFGKNFIAQEESYKKGQSGLAYEIVINTNPSIAYLMETNTMTMQALVMAHASCGHSSFFKNNYLFKSHTKADYIIEYLQFAKDYIRDCEIKYGEDEVEDVLDCCATLRHHGIFKYPRKNRKASKEEEVLKILHNKEELYDDLLSQTGAMPGIFSHNPYEETTIEMEDGWQVAYKKVEPEENLLYFIEKNAQNLESWHREIIRICRTIDQYFYPQMQTQVMNEGWASFWHYHIMIELWERGHITDNSYFEFIKSHTGVIYQPSYSSPYYSGINPYTLGFNMFMDLKKICEDPEEIDYELFPEIAGTEWKESLTDIMKNFRDTSFIQQWLSPRVAQKLKLFCVEDDSEKDVYVVEHTSDIQDFIEFRRKFAKTYEISERIPELEVIGVSLDGDLMITHRKRNDMKLSHDAWRKILPYITALWGGNGVMLLDDEEEENEKSLW